MDSSEARQRCDELNAAADIEPGIRWLARQESPGVWNAVRVVVPGLARKRPTSGRWEPRKTGPVPSPDLDGIDIEDEPDQPAGGWKPPPQASPPTSAPRPGARPWPSFVRPPEPAAPEQQPAARPWQPPAQGPPAPAPPPLASPQRSMPGPPPFAPPQRSMPGQAPFAPEPPPPGPPLDEEWTPLVRNWDALPPLPDLPPLPPPPPAAQQPPPAPDPPSPPPPDTPPTLNPNWAKRLRGK